MADPDARKYVLLVRAGGGEGESIFPKREVASNYTALECVYSTIGRGRELKPACR